MIHQVVAIVSYLEQLKKTKSKDEEEHKKVIKETPIEGQK